MGKKIITWEDVYQLPLKYDGYTYCWSKNVTMSIMFDPIVSKKNREKITSAINNETSEKIEGLKYNGCEFYINGIYVFCVRGWGYLTGIGALNLDEEKALEIQNDFIRYIYEKLT